MQVSEFTFRLILLFVPGLIAFFIADSLTTHKETKFYKIALLSLVYGFICYLIYYFITLIPCFNLQFSFFQSVINSSTNLNFKEIIVVTFLSFPIALLLSALINYRILYRFAHFIKVSRQIGNIGVWGITMELYNDHWVIIRDLENNLTYRGWQYAYSDITDEREEFLLRDVEIFTTSTGELQYQVSALYLARDKRNLNIEFAPNGYTRYNKLKENTEGNND